jgi:hypothetical protein
MENMSISALFTSQTVRVYLAKSHEKPTVGFSSDQKVQKAYEAFH